MLMRQHRRPSGACVGIELYTCMCSYICVIYSYMSSIEKLLKKFLETPQSVRYRDIERILRYFNFEKISAKGSHVKWKQYDMTHDIIIPIHHNECKEFYKKQVSIHISSFMRKHHENKSNGDHKK